MCLQLSVEPHLLAQKATGGGPQSRIVRQGDDGSWWFAKGPMTKADAGQLAAVSDLLERLPGKFVRGQLARHGDKFYEAYKSLAYVRDGLDAPPSRLVHWTSKGGGPKSQWILDWGNGVSGAGADLFFTMKHGHLSEASDALKKEYLRQLLSRACAGVGDSAPRNAWFDCTAMPREFEGRPEVWIRSLPDQGASRLYSGDFDKQCSGFTTTADLWDVAVGNKHARAVDAALRATAKSFAPELFAEYDAIDPKELPEVAQRRVQLVLQMFMELAHEPVPPVAAAPEAVPVEVAAPQAAAPPPEAAGSASLNGIGLIDAFWKARPTTTVLGKFTPQQRQELVDIITERMGPQGPEPPTNMTTGILASGLQKTYRSGDPETIAHCVPLAHEAFLHACRLLEAEAVETGVTSAYQAFLTFFMGRIAIMAAEDAAADPAGIGGLTLLFETIQSKWSATKPRDKAAVLGWLQDRASTIAEVLRRLTTLGLLTPKRARWGSSGSCSGVWPKPPTGKQKVDEKAGRWAPRFGVWLVEGVPIALRDILLYDASVSYADNVASALGRLGSYVAEVHAADRIPSDVMGGLVRLIEAMKWASQTFNEAHVFLWLSIAVCTDPAFHPRAEHLVLPCKAERTPDAVVGGKFLAMALDKHVSSKFPWFDPQGTMDANHVYVGDFPDFAIDHSAPKARTWFAVMAARYDKQRAEANKEALGKAASRKRPAPE